MSNGITAMWDDYNEYKWLADYFKVRVKTNGYSGPLPYNMDSTHFEELKKQYREERRH